MLRKDIKAWAEPLESSIRVPFIMGAMRLDRWKMIAKFCCSEVGYARYLSLNMQTCMESTRRFYCNHLRFFM